GKQKIDALFFATNTLSIHGLKYLNRKKLRVPDDVAVVCFDECDAFDFFYCPLTYVKQPLVEVGQQAVNILLKKINNPEKEEEQVSLASDFVIKKSSAK